MLTEFWADPATIVGRIGPARVRDRYHRDLAGANVESWNLASLAQEVLMRAKSSDEWAVIMDRNEWFQTRAVRAIARIRDDRPRTVFAYSYAALRIFELARKRGWQTFLGQIDPGPVEDRLVAELHRRHSRYVDTWTSPPPAYWDAWRRECEIADRIVVNSRWSRDSLITEGVSEAKTVVVPLSYEAPKGSAEVRRNYPERFTAERPLRVLFLGQVILRKGIIETLEAAAMLQGEPVEFWMVGRDNAKLSRAFRLCSNVKWLGSVPQSETAEHYCSADVFLFSTHSDGFGLTQLEAQAWRLPTIASRNCGDVVRDAENGVLLPSVSALAIAEAIRGLLANPARLAQFSERHLREERFGLDFLADSLTSLAEGRQ